MTEILQFLSGVNLFVVALPLSTSSDPPRLRTGEMLILKRFSAILHTYKPSFLITLSIKKTASKSIGSFKDLIIHRDSQREATLLYTKL
jgi:hypothetical protein